MNDSKYEQLRIEFEQTENIKKEFRRLFTEQFSNYMGCPLERIELSIENAVVSSNSTEYNVTLMFSVPVGENERVVEFDGISFIYDFDNEQSKPTYKISFDREKTLLDRNAESVFGRIYEWLRSDSIPLNMRDSEKREASHDSNDFAIINKW